MKAAKKWAKSTLPRWLQHLLLLGASGVYRQHCADVAVVRKATRDSIISGPFAGIRYPETRRIAALVPKLCGTFERELVPVLEQIKTRTYSTIIDIGAAEGFYAIGF